MNIVMELALIFGVCLVGVIVASIMPFAVPYSVISLLILMTYLAVSKGHQALSD